MQSKHHFAISVVVGAITATIAGAPPPGAALLVAYAAGVGVLIDLDHFLIARLRTGSWRAARFALANPDAVLFDQDRLFRDGEVGRLPRLLSHHLVGGVVVAGLATADAFLALFTAVVVYAHVVSDLAQDVREVEGGT